MMSMFFNDFPWHDANLIEIFIDRRNPGNRDEVKITVEWPGGGTDSILFKECYAFVAFMNFGIIANESILDANEFNIHENLTTLKNKLAPIKEYLLDLKLYRIETNSTGGTLEIYAKYFTIEST